MTDPPETILLAPEHDAETRDRRREALREIVRLGAAERLDRVYLFEPLSRREVAFRLALVTKRTGEGRLEMIAIGERAEKSAPPARDFVRRARFPEAVLPSILEEFIERCGVEGARYREVRLDRGAGVESHEDPIDPLLDLLGSEGA